MKEYKSIMRKMFNDAHKIPHIPIKNLEEARRTNDAVMIFEGDWGGTIYLSCPIKYVICNENELQCLLNYIDSLYWNELDGANIFYEVIKPGQGIAGGMGGGLVIDGIWIHPKIVELSIENKIIETITGLIV